MHSHSTNSIDFITVEAFSPSQDLDHAFNYNGKRDIVVKPHMVCVVFVRRNNYEDHLF